MLNNLFDLFFHHRINSLEHSDELICFGVAFLEIVVVSIEFSYDATEVVIFHQEFGDFFFEDEVLLGEFFGFGSQA